MIRKFCFFIILFSSFFIIDNVRAVEYDEDIIEKCKTFANRSYTTDYQNNNVILYSDKLNGYYVPIPGVYNGDVWKSSGWGITYYSDHVVLISPNWWVMNFYRYNADTGTFTKVTSSLSSWYTGNKSSVILDNDYNFKIVYADKDIYSKADFTYENKDYSSGDVFYQNKIEPTININLSYTKYNDNNDPIQAKINIDWAIKDLNSYKYMWKSVNDDNWRYFFSEDVTDEILINRNGSYIFQVNDSDDNYITSASITLTSLSEQLPTLKLDDYTGVGCYYENQQYCKILTLYSENADFSKYTLQYRFSNGEWITHNYDNSVKGQIKIYENTTLTARLIRNSDNELIDSKSYTITNINTEILTDVPKIKFDKTFCKNLDPENFHEIGQGNFKQTLKMTIYGLDMTKYRVFTAEKNTNNFVEITDFEYEDRVPLVKYYYFEYYQDTTFFVKITDLDENYVTGTAYTLHFTCNDISTELDDLNDMNDIFDVVKNFFNKFKDIMSKFKEVIEYFYNSLNSEIRAFILTAVILIISLNLIMRMIK